MSLIQVEKTKTFKVRNHRFRLTGILASRETVVKFVRKCLNNYGADNRDKILEVGRNAKKKLINNFLSDKLASK